MLRIRSLLAAAFTFVTIACASAPGAGAGGGGAGKGPITAEEVVTANVPNAYEAVSRLRLSWLRDRATGATPLVYLGTQRQVEGVGALRSIRAGEIGEIQFVARDAAVARWGLEAQGGAIVVVPK